MKKHFMFIVFIFLNCVVLFGQETEEKPEVKKEEKKQDVNSEVEIKKTEPPQPPAKPWWTQSAKNFEKEGKWKFHLEGEIKYTYNGGTLDSHLLESNIMFSSRYNNFTNFMFVEWGVLKAIQNLRVYNEADGVVSSTDIEIKVNLKKFQFVELLRYDFTKNIFADFGYEGFRDDVSYIRTRHTYFAGVGYQFDWKKHHFSFLAGGGYEDSEYTPRNDLAALGIPEFVPIEETPNSAAAYFQYKGDVYINKMMTFHQSFFYTAYAESDRKDRWELKLRLMFRLAPKISYFNAFKMIKEENKTAEAAGADDLNVELITGIRFNF